MTGKRSRQGCGECRKRRRKCDEAKPSCGQCVSYNRTCTYELRLVWSWKAGVSKTGLVAASRADGSDSSRKSRETMDLAIPESLPNGIALPRRYRRLLHHFAEGVLASLSSHPTIHRDFCRGLMPTVFESPHLLSASLALSASSLASRGFEDVEGTSISRIIHHLQSSGLPLLRTALEEGQKSEILVATCLIWCLADVFSGTQGMSRWPIHLQGIKALLRGQQPFNTDHTALRSAMKHLYMLYRALETLPYIPSIAPQASEIITVNLSTASTNNSQIDGFLGYSEDLLDILQQMNNRKSKCHWSTEEAGVLLERLKAMISRDVRHPPGVSISSLSSQAGRDFALCNKVFQQATLIQLYRQLYGLSSASEPIRTAVQTINEMIGNMAQGEPCHTWVAMAMPLFTVGCEAYKDKQKSFVMDKIHKLEICIGSLHVKVIEQALKDMWKLREEYQDYDGNLCAGYLLEKLSYNIVLF